MSGLESAGEAGSPAGGDEAGRRYEFELAAGRVIRLVSLDQSWTYGGLLAGSPHRQMNRHILAGLVQRYVRRDHGLLPLLLEPLQTPFEIGADVPAGSASATLPAAVCAARFRSGALPGDERGIGSVLRVIWFQDDMAYPIDPSIVVELQAIDWDAHAHSWIP